MEHVVIATWTARAETRERIAEILTEMTPGNRAEPKMLEFRAHVSTSDPNTFVLYERYADETGYEDHRSTEAFQKLVLGEAIGLLADRKIETVTPLLDESDR